MLAVILKILSILGIILLILLGLALLILLLVLFIPLVYKADAEKVDSDMMVKVRIRWLFGFLRVKFDYPEPGNISVKVLWKTVFDSGNKSKKEEEQNQTTLEENATESTDATAVATESVSKQQENKNQLSDSIQESVETKTDDSPDTVESEKKTLSEKLFAKYEKIKYTIQQFYDKIKYIWDNISFYKKLLQDEQTKLLISHVFRRLGKILRHIRPRKLKADVTFGTGEPDTTGYAYAIYGMFSPQLGKNVFVTPDFTQKILVGNVHAAGHISVFTLLVNVLAVLLDKRLHLLIRRLKNHTARQNKQKCAFQNEKAEA